MVRCIASVLGVEMQVNLMLDGQMSSADIRPFTAHDRDWLLAKHIEHYAASDGFDAQFGVLVEQVLDGFVKTDQPDIDKGWIAYGSAGRLGSIFCSQRDDTTAQLRLFFLLPEARGQGLGRRLLKQCTDHARRVGFKQMTLWTHESHRAACALYAASGWELLESTPVQSFGQNLVQQNWRFHL